MKQAAVSELEEVLGQISKLLREAKGTFRKNRCVCLAVSVRCAVVELQLPQRVVPCIGF
jgi:hypothetical protein